MRPLAIVEAQVNALAKSSLAAIRAASFWHTAIDVVVVGQEATTVGHQLAAIEGVARVLTLVTDNSHSAQWQVAQLRPLVADYDVVLAVANSFGQAVIPLLAANHGCNAYSDVLAMVDNQTLVRPVYAGEIRQTVVNQSDKLFLTIRAAAFQPAIKTSGSSALIEPLAIAITEDRWAKVVDRQQSDTGRPKLEEASRVVAGGRALRDPQGFQLVFDLADCLGAAVGASRAAVDAGLVSNDHQIGQTGKVIAPELYIAVGISGAAQHLAGIKDSRVIVAINQDPDAPIFSVADYGLVGDVFEVVPELIRKLTSGGV